MMSSTISSLSPAMVPPVKMALGGGGGGVGCLVLVLVLMVLVGCWW